MRKLAIIIIAALSIAACTSKVGIIHVKTPARPAGQQDVLGLALDPIDTVRVGFIGLGMRGPGAVERFCYLPQTRIVALCDVEEENVAKCKEITARHSRPEPEGYSGSERYSRGGLERGSR